MDCRIVGIVSSAKNRHSQFLQMGHIETPPFLLGECLLAANNCQTFHSSDQNYTLILHNSINMSFEDFISLYEKEKLKSFESLEGNFFLLFYDKRQDDLYFFRSKQCLMPFYWSEKRDFLFSNSLKPLFSCQSIAKKIDPYAIKAYLQLGFIPSPFVPIQNTNELMPGFMLIYQSSEQITLTKVEHKEIEYQNTPLNMPKPAEPLTWTTLIKQIYFLESPNSLLFFPAILQNSDSPSFFITQPQILAHKKQPSFPFKAFLPKSRFLNWFSVWFIKQRFYVHSLMEFEKTPYCFFTSHELNKHSPALKESFEIYCFLAKQYYEKGLNATHFETLYLSQSSIFAFANRNQDPQSQNTIHTQELIHHFLTTPDHLKEVFIPKLQEEAKLILSRGVLSDLDIIDRKLIEDLEVANPEHIKKLWNLIILELWFRIFIEISPNEQDLTQIEKSLNDIITKKTLL